MKDSANLDALRSVAVLLVVLSHFPRFLPGDLGLDHGSVLGRMGVMIFFVHTTLVLMLSMERNGASPGPFFVRRVFRIYPLSMATVLALAGILWIIGKPLGVSELASNLLLTQHITGHRSWPYPLWSLPYEVAMYLVLPALFVFARSVGRVVALYSAALGTAVLAYANGVDSLLVALAPCFLSGALAFVLLGRVRRAMHPAAIFALVAIAAVPQLMAGKDDGQFQLWAWGLCLALGLVIPLCRESRWAFGNLWAQQIAKYSYGIYLTHVLALTVALGGGFPWWAKVALYVALQALLAVIAYRLIEAPGIRLGVRLAERMGRSRLQQA